jgi:hypothetical protein
MGEKCSMFVASLNQYIYNNTVFRASPCGHSRRGHPISTKAGNAPWQFQKNQNLIGMYGVSDAARTQNLLLLRARG